MCHVHIGIVTYNSATDLPGCINAILQQTYPHITISIVDNASTDDTVAWLHKRLHDVRVICNRENIGFGRAHNQIIRQLDFDPNDYYLALNPDVQMQSTYVENLLHGLKQHDAAWGGGKLLLPATGRIYSIGHALQRDGYALNIGHRLPDGPPFDDSREVFGTPAAAALYSAALLTAFLERDGEVFDETMFMYYEDVDLDWRARLAGWRCWYIVDAVATHRGSVASPEMRDHALANRFLMLIKNAHVVELWTRVLPVMLAHLAFRLLVTPPRGYRIVRHLLLNGRAAIRKRSKPQNLQYWYAWTKHQPTQSPKTLRERLQSFRLQLQE